MVFAELTGNFESNELPRADAIRTSSAVRYELGVAEREIDFANQELERFEKYAPKALPAIPLVLGCFFTFSIPFIFQVLFLPFWRDGNQYGIALSVVGILVFASGSVLSFLGFQFSNEKRHADDFKMKKMTDNLSDLQTKRQELMNELGLKN